MRWSFRIARVFGISIYVHWTFALLILWVIYIHWSQASAAAAAQHRAGVPVTVDPFAQTVEGVLLVCAVFACVVLHELGHSLAAKRYGIPTRDITLLPIGGVARLERMPEKPAEELVVAAAGPAVNVVIAAVLLAALIATGSLDFSLGLFQAGGGFFSKLAWLNVVLVVFNLIPAFPMDGGRILRALLATSMDYTRATAIAAGVGQALAIVFGILGLFFNPFLLFIALFVFIGAQAEAHAATRRAAVEGVPVREAMVRRFRVLVPDESVAAAIEEMRAGLQTDFPVMDGGEVVGLVTRRELIEALAGGRGNARVGEVMRRQCLTVRDTEMLADVLPRMQAAGCTALVVVRNGDVVGLLTHENIGEMMMINAAYQRARNHPGAYVQKPAGFPEGIDRA